MDKLEMINSSEFKELLKRFLIEEGFGVCDVRNHFEMYSLKFKPRASESEIDARIEYFVERHSSCPKIYLQRSITVQDLWDSFLFGCSPNGNTPSNIMRMRQFDKWFCERFEIIEKKQ